MQITKITIGRAKVHVEYENEAETFKVDSTDRPLPSLYAAMKALAPVACTICGFPKTYIGKPHPKDQDKTQFGLRVTGLIITEKQGAPRAVIECKKDLPDSDLHFAFSTPARFLKQPDEEGTYSPPIAASDVALIEQAIEEAKKYALNERAQGQLPFPEDENDDDNEKPSEPSEGEPTLPFPQQNDTGTPVKPKKRRG